MQGRSVACLLAAGFLGLGLTTVAVSADAKPIVVEGDSFDPRTQRRVSYADLNLAARPDQKVFRLRLYRTAGSLCRDLGHQDLSQHSMCQEDAIRSTDAQVAIAIDRASNILAGRAVGPAIAISMVIGSR